MKRYSRKDVHGCIKCVCEGEREGEKSILYGISKATFGMLTS